MSVRPNRSQESSLRKPFQWSQINYSDESKVATLMRVYKSFPFVSTLVRTRHVPGSRRTWRSVFPATFQGSQTYAVVYSFISKSVKLCVRQWCRLSESWQRDEVWYRRWGRRLSGAPHGHICVWYLERLIESRITKLASWTVQVFPTNKQEAVVGCLRIFLSSYLPSGLFSIRGQYVNMFQ